MSAPFPPDEGEIGAVPPDDAPIDSAVAPVENSLPTDELHAAAMRGLRWTVLARPVVEVFLLASMVVLARLVPPADFGRYAVALVVLELLLVPATAVGTALVQRPNAGERKYMQTGYALTLLSGVGLIALTLIAAKVLIEPIFDHQTAVMVRLSAVVCVINMTNIVPSAMLQRRLAFRKLSVVQVVNTVARVVASIALAVAGWGGEALVVGGIIGTIPGTILLWCWAPPPRPWLWREPARDLSSYGIPAAMAAFGWVGFRNCDYAIVGARLGPLQAGFYYRGYTLGVEYQKKVSQVMSTVGFPLLARAQGDGEQHALRTRMVRLLTLVLFPSLALLSILAPVLIPRLFGSEWDNTIAPTQVLAIGGAATLAMDAVGASLMASGRARAMLGFGWAHFLTYAAAVLIISPMGITAVAGAAAVVHSAFLVVAYVILVHGTGESAARHLWGDLSPALISCAALVAVALPESRALASAHVSALPQLVLVSVSGSIAYLAALRVFFPTSFASLMRLAKRLLPNRPGRGMGRASVAAPPRTESVA